MTARLKALVVPGVAFQPPCWNFDGDFFCYLLMWLVVNYITQKEKVW